MKIILLRHGKPDTPTFGPISASELCRWIEAYNSAPLDTRNKPSNDVVAIAQHCNAIVCSDLRRSIESAKTLGVSDIHSVDAIFREFELPYSNSMLGQGMIKLPPSIWAVIYRICWFMGYANHSETFVAAKLRAESATHKLLNIAQRHETVLFVGHSLLNGYIAKNLLSKGWQGGMCQSHKYWEISEFVDL